MISLWCHIYGEQRGILSLFSGERPKPGSKELKTIRTAYFTWPEERERAHVWVKREAAAGREVYHCAHLLAMRHRTKENAAPVQTLWVDGDGAKVPEDVPGPTAIIESSPNRTQLYWRLSHSVPLEEGERLNRRLALAVGADKSGWDLTQLLRPPGTPNFKYAACPPVRILDLKDERYDPMEFDRLLPLPKEASGETATRLNRPKHAALAPDLSRLSLRMRELIRYGNRDEYGSRSEADMAVCIAMFGASFDLDEVWAVMTDATNGISEKFVEKGRHGERYLEVTISKAQAIAKSSRHRICEKPPKSEPAARNKVVVRGG